MFNGKRIQRDSGKTWCTLCELTSRKQKGDDVYSVNVDFEKVFEFELQEKLKLSCGDEGEVTKDLQLLVRFPQDIKEEKVFYLEDLFKSPSPVKTEEYLCVVCGKYVTATGHVMLKGFPKILGLRLLRYKEEYTEKGEDVSYKLCNRVVIPEYLEIGDQVSSLYKYRLKATTLHSGPLSFGHYIAIVRYDDNWFTCNDETVTKVPDLSFYSIEQGDPNLTGYKRTTTPGTSYSTFQPHFLSYVLESIMTYDPKTYVKPERPPIPDDPKR